MLNQNSAALKPVKKSKSIIGTIQKTIVYGEQGNIAKMTQGLNNIKGFIPPNTKTIIKMVQDKYGFAANDACISQDDLYKEQLKNMLLAA